MAFKTEVSTLDNSSEFILPFILPSWLKPVLSNGIVIVIVLAENL